MFIPMDILGVIATTVIGAIAIAWFLGALHEIAHSLQINTDASNILEEYGEKLKEESRFIPKALAWDWLYDSLGLKDNKDYLDRILQDVQNRIKDPCEHKLSLSAIDVDLQRGTGNVLVVCECLKYSAVGSAAEMSAGQCVYATVNEKGSAP